MIDIRQLDPVINISEESTEVAIARASTCKKVHITIENIPESKIIEIPVIHGMEKIMQRETVSKKQFLLISELFNLLTIA